ncbi:MAG TPA: hypothetical protein VKZ85_03395 [Woeseiaceae bacterium]|nr:hypothetical protein [Woeseiaceae bacterium]
MCARSAFPRAARRVFLLFAAGVLLPACGGGGGGGGTADPAPGGGGGPGGGGNPSAPVTISGVARYQFPPPRVACGGRDFAAVELRPIRQATVQLLAEADDAVLDSVVTDETGAFAVTADRDTRVYLRVRAELKRTGVPAWDVEVRDNTSNTTAPLAQRPLYVLDTEPFDSGTSDMTRDVTAATGWGGTSYVGPRAAAPFAILDTAYSAIRLVLSAEPEATFAPLDIFWSPDNRPAEGDVADGDIATSHYRPGQRQLFLLGALDDPDEFDEHVVAHEWGHYYEDTFSRSDSIGGPHMLGDALDMRVAFGEGWATALSGMALADPLYCDTTLTSGFPINIEGGGGGTPGWFNEISVLRIVYDLWDTEDDGADTGSIGFGPIHAAMTGPQATTPAFTSIFSFAEALRTIEPAAVPLLDALLEEADISLSSAFGENESNGGQRDDALPVYTEIAPDGTTHVLCSSRNTDAGGDGNKLGAHRFLRMSLTRPAQLHFDIRTRDVASLPPDDPGDDRDQSDPDILILRNGQVQNASVPGENPQGFSPDANQEVFTTSNVLQAGEYAMALTEFRYSDPDTHPDYPDRTCFDVTVTEAS